MQAEGMVTSQADHYTSAPALSEPLVVRLTCFDTCQPLFEGCGAIPFFGILLSKSWALLSMSKTNCDFPWALQRDALACSLSCGFAIMLLS